MLCRLWPAATKALQTLRRGCDADYLAAQLLWRSGDVAAAARRLRESIDGRGVLPAKSGELLRMLEPWHELDRNGTLAFEDGECCSHLAARPGLMPAALTLQDTDFILKFNRSAMPPHQTHAQRPRPWLQIG